MALVRRTWFVLLLFTLLIGATRIPILPGQLFTWDDVNFAWSIGHYDIRTSQPHPPGYPLFVVEMRILYWLRFHRPESLLNALALVGSLAAVLLIWRVGRDLFASLAGFFAAWLLTLHPVFWYNGAASALRIQLAVVSLAVAAACWRAWNGDPRWVLRSAIVLGLGAGIRPELGPLLLPLWIACALRAPVSWRDRAIALGAMAAAVLLWLAPAMIASGGPVRFVQACLDYLTDQASVSSGLFGATESRWRTTFWRTMTWLFCGLSGTTMAAVLAWRRREGWAIGSERLAFLGLWFLPPFVFAILVHAEDSGHVLAMVPAIALVGGHWMSRAVANVDQQIGRWYAAALGAAACAVEWMLYFRNTEFGVFWIPVVCLAMALLWKVQPVKNFGSPPRLLVFLLLLTPVAMLDRMMFQHVGWYYRGTTPSGWRAVGEQVTSDVSSGLALTSWEHLHNTLAIDDGSIRELRRLAAERPGATVVLWERGLTSWRKAAYYAPDVPIVVLEHRKIRAGSPPVVARWRGGSLESRTQGTPPQQVSIPAGSRIVWFLNPATDFYRLAREAFPLTPAGPVYYTDLPAEPSARVLGEYEIVTSASPSRSPQSPPAQTTTGSRTPAR